MMPDVARISDLVREVAAEEILPRFRRLAAEDVREKRPGNLVTTADLASEARLINGLAAIAPEATVVAEEMAEADLGGVLGRLSGEAPVWVIDPVDGTANFAAGKEDFAVIVAYVERGRTRVGLIYEPARDRLTVAEEGGGAWQDGTRLAVAAPVPLREMQGSLALRLRREPEITRQLGHLTSLRSAGCEHVMMSSGRSHYAMYRRAWPWDHAAGALIHAEAGGYSAHFDGEPYGPARPPEQGLMLATDRASWKLLHDLAMPALQR